ncbi:MULTISPECIES: TAXI family TRAP transporter solute-binding subunit [Neobacillus]|uniref:TAXI family TRAP transporter solute-binding subunit n=1 Tax=Neobacillus rhizophilus TaxID=2833579 RepID=A0A942TY99_9BACI|nr:MULTISPECIES: TAXI family TRAP transporter solute-binding subunit [Neobacillus]MBS4211011.1 TAXI family TRAP transporter solute-binding subunit [Neobacillus rhizophilus]MBU8917439.1 TAXI family TRAP transporter solute-binding subunit [Bacillus sp. FJAT-29953]
MKKKKFLLSMIFVVVMSMILAACGSSTKEEEETTTGTSGGEKAEEKPKFISILTGGTGGTYYPLGGSFAKIIKDATGIEANAETSGASAENMNTLKNGDGEIAFTQTDIAAYAVDGKLMFKEKVGNIKAIATLYPETIQIVTTKKSGIKSIADLKGKKVSVGAPGSGTAANAEQILEVHGLSFKDIQKQDLSFDESTQGIQDGTIDAAFVTAGTPTGAVESLSATEDVVIVPIAQDKIDALIKKYPYYIKDEVPPGTYGLSSVVSTVAVQAMLVARSDLSEQVVYDITKAIFENLDKVTHAKGKLIKVENALNGVGIDVHPGAKKYFDEKGVKAQ